jgi:hypothetical protein
VLSTVPKTLARFEALFALLGMGLSARWRTAATCVEPGLTI